MKVICPISGVPFRTFDSLTVDAAYEHPIFHVPFERLCGEVLNNIKQDEEELLLSWNKNSSAQKQEVDIAATMTDLTSAATQAIAEKHFKNPAFRLYQAKHLVMLALMHKAQLLVIDKGYVARPKPKIIDSHFWSATESFVWVNTISNPVLLERIPKYKITKETEGFENLSEYLEAINTVKVNVGGRFREASTERKLAAWEMAISILTRRREVLKEKLSTSHNPLAAKWALTITNAPKEYWDFWYAILSSPSTKITFEGVKLNDKWEAVTAGDLRELYDWLDDNLVRPKGDVGEYHRDDSEFYFMARQTVLEIVKTHILILEQGTSSYRIVNAAMGDEIISYSDDVLEAKAIAAGIDGAKRPSFADHLKKIDFIRAMAGWRINAKTKLLELSHPEGKTQEQLSKDEKAQYEIL